MNCQWATCERDAFWAPTIIMVTAAGREFPTFLNLPLCLEHRNELKLIDLVTPESFADFWGKVYPVLTHEPVDRETYGRMRLDFTSLESEPMKVMAKARAERDVKP